MGADRRAFFREAALRLVRPVAEYVEPRVARGRRHLLRPPGAIDERHFADTCQRCGACVDICPADAIFAMPTTAGAGDGTPMIDPDRAACVVCDGLKCTTVCPSGALLPLSDPHAIRMGLAEVYDAVCVRSSGETCTICADRCPLGTTAIRIPAAPPAVPDVVTDGCVGCGVCQLYCPTSPKAIVVRPL